MVIVTTIRRDVLTLPAAPLGPDNPLPPLRLLRDGGTSHALKTVGDHRIDVRDRDDLPRDMARQAGYGPLHSLLPVRVRDGYGRERAPREFETIVIENDRLRATVLPGLGGRVASLVHKPTGSELLYRNPVFQPANLALNGAWFSGGIEWNIGATGHTTLSCAPLHAARVPAPDGGEMLRLWEWERLRDLYADAFDDLCHERRDDGESWTAATAALGREAIEALLAAGRTAEARSVWERLCPVIRARGRFRLIEARLLLAEERPEAARAVFEEGFEVADLREGAEAISELWSRLSDEPLPPFHDFRMRPET